MIRRTAVLALLAIVVGALSAFAQERVVIQTVERPLMSLSRASIAIGPNYEWYSAAGDEPVPQFGHEWSVGVFGAYNLFSAESGRANPGDVSLAGSTVYGLDNQQFRTTLGLRWRIFVGR